MEPGFDRSFEVVTLCDWNGGFSESPGFEPGVPAPYSPLEELHCWKPRDVGPESGSVTFEMENGLILVYWVAETSPWVPLELRGRG